MSVYRLYTMWLNTNNRLEIYGNFYHVLHVYIKKILPVNLLLSQTFFFSTN